MSSKALSLTSDQRLLIAYALRELVSAVDVDTLGHLGRDEIDELEHGNEDSDAPFTDANADAVIEGRIDDLENELEELAKLFD